jgi:hypothetical protein
MKVRDWKEVNGKGERERTGSIKKGVDQSTEGITD